MCEHMEVSEPTFCSLCKRILRRRKDLREHLVREHKVSYVEAISGYAYL